GHSNHFEAIKALHHAHFAHEENHAETLAGALRVPDDAAALIASRSLPPRVTFLQPCNGFVNRAELLIARDDLTRLAIHLLKDREVAHQIKQVCRPQHTGDENLLAAQASTIMLHRRWPLLWLAEKQRHANAFGLFRP